MNRSTTPTAIQLALADAAPGTIKDDSYIDVYEAIVHLVKDALSGRAGTAVLGICGPQGSGKSTIANALVRILKAAESLSAVVLSLDDLYLSREARASLAKSIHPLLATRGVPGTHDVELGIRVVRELAGATPTTRTLIPRFDKAVDEPRPRDQWDAFDGRPDVVILEGWCVGALPQDEVLLTRPVNLLEINEDPDGRWRAYVNANLASRYQDLFALIDALILLNAPGFESVAEWRQQQEDELAAKSALAEPSEPNSRVMNSKEIRRFVAHFERITRHMLVEMPGRADLVVNLDARRGVTNVQ